MAIGRDEALWAEERFRTERVLGRIRLSQRDMRRHVGIGMVALLGLLAVAAAGIVIALLSIAGSWVAHSLMPHFVQTAAAKEASCEIVRTAVGAVAWLLGAR